MNSADHLLLGLGHFILKLGFLVRPHSFYFKDYSCKVGSHRFKKMDSKDLGRIFEDLGPGRSSLFDSKKKLGHPKVYFLDLALNP